MNCIETKEKMCSICLSEGAEHYGLKRKFKYLLNLVSPEMCLQVSEDSYMCCDCLKTLVNLYCFKSRSVENDKKIRTRVIEKGQKINISEVVYPYFSIDTDINACRLCLCVIKNSSFLNLFAQVEKVCMIEMLRISLPELKMDITYNPLFCDTCTKKLQMLYKFNKKCMETGSKIRIYLEDSSENVGKANKICLLKIAQYLKEAEDMKLINFKYDCDRCSFRGHDESEMNQHKLLFHQKAVTATGTENRSKPFKCTICNLYETDKKCNLYQHVARHTKKSAQTFDCTICHFQTNFKREFNKHKLQHASQKGISTYQCPKCPYTSDKRRNFSRHFTRHQQSEQKTELNEIYKCSLCPFETTTECNFKQHIVLHKSNEPVVYVVYQCETKKDTITNNSLGHKHQEEN